MSAESSSETIPSGYKQTEVGVIPEDWDVHMLRNCLSAPPDYGINAPAVPFSDKLPVYIRITDITEDGRFSPDKLVSVNRADADNYYLKDGDIVFARTGASVGKSYLYKPKDRKLVFAGFLIRVSPNDAKLFPAYLAGYVTTGAYWNWVRLMSMRSGQPGINGKEYGQLPIPLPPTLAEQEAIAEALGDADAFIESLEQLISKKRQIKQGAMQELLTGKRRLPGFGEGKGYKQTDLGVIPEDWDVVNLADVGRNLAGLTYSPSNVRDFGTLVLRSSNVQNGKLVFEDNVYVDMALPERVIVEKDDILICVRNGSRQLIGKCALIDESAAGNAFGAFMSIYRSKYSKYVFYQFQSEIIQRQINEIMGATINQITNKDMASFIIPFPHSDEEKNVIAAILSDMDSEITALEEKLAKARQIKQGMMQELLTGRIRLL
jgi:type I restriction enzyme S subunit